MKSYSEYSIVQNPASICPPELFGQLVAIPIRFIAFPEGLIKGIGDEIEGGGIIEVRGDLIADMEELFRFMLAERFPLSSVLPIACFGWNDERSMVANNTSGFNYRMIAGTKRLSNHASGRAIDINPLLNPFIRGEIIQPAGAIYDPLRPGTLTATSPVTRFLKDRGWIWGGDWESLKDYQHFEKPE